MNYHVLPCGTPIPPEGIEAWVKNVYGAWLYKTIISCFNGRVVFIDEGDEKSTRVYSLTDPTKPNKRLVTPMGLLGKYVWWNPYKILQVNGIDQNYLFVGPMKYIVDIIYKECKGYSDTPTSEIKSFWVEEA